MTATAPHGAQSDGAGDRGCAAYQRRGRRVRAQMPLDFDAAVLLVAPSPHPAARQTSARAALATAPAKARKSAELLRLLSAAGASGMTDPEIARATGWPRQTVCSTRNAVRSLLEPSGARRPSEYGHACVVWRRRTA